MAKVIGIDTSKYKRFTCQHCCSIIEYAPNEEYWDGRTDEGQKIMGLCCPACGRFQRTNY